MFGAETQTEATLPAHGQFTAKDGRPPNNPAAEVLYFTGAPEWECSAMRKTIVAIFALAIVGLVQPTVVSARGLGAGVGYPASFGSDYAEGRDCRLVAHRVKTHKGWRIRRIQVCG
jgi:hypothetical protein